MNQKIRFVLVMLGAIVVLNACGKDATKLDDNSQTNATETPVSSEEKAAVNEDGSLVDTTENAVREAMEEGYSYYLKDSDGKEIIGFNLATNMRVGEDGIGNGETKMYYSDEESDAFYLYCGSVRGDQGFAKFLLTGECELSEYGKPDISLEYLKDVVTNVGTFKVAEYTYKLSEDSEESISEIAILWVDGVMVELSFPRKFDLSNPYALSIDKILHQMFD